MQNEGNDFCQYQIIPYLKESSGIWFFCTIWEGVCKRKKVEAATQSLCQNRRTKSIHLMCLALVRCSSNNLTTRRSHPYAAHLVSPAHLRR